MTDSGDIVEHAPSWRFIPHPDAERFDAVTVETIERWKDSELSGDEWRFSYVVKFWRNGVVAASCNGGSVEDALLQAAAKYRSIKTDDGGGYMGPLNEVCCQPSCFRPWVVLMHPIKRYGKDGSERVRPYDDDDVRAFCERHRHRGDCALDDADVNYVVVEERFPPDWATEREA
jgi:hypothetical protein